MRRRNFLIVALAVVVVLVLALLVRQPVTERTRVDDKNVIFGSNFQLNDTHDGDLVVAGDDLSLNDGSRVLGNASLIGKTVHIGGHVSGDLTVFAETVTLDPGAVIEGRANLMGTHVSVGGAVLGDLLVNSETLDIAPSANLVGAVDACVNGPINDQRPSAAALSCSGENVAPFAGLIALRNSGFTPQPIAMLVLVVLSAALLTGVSALAVTLFPRQISHIEEAVRARPRSFGGVGIATYALALGVSFGLIFVLALLPPLGLLLVPVYLIFALLLGLLILTGLVTFALILGDWLLRRVSELPMPPLIAAIAGSLVLSALLGGIALLPFGFVIGTLLLGAVSSVGLGAALFTRVGTRPMHPVHFIQG